jgi:hypothetical protein
MSRSKRIVIVTGLTLLASGVAAALAFGHAYFVETKELKEAGENQAIVQVASATRLKGTINNIPIEIYCATSTLQGTLEKAGESKAKLKFENCILQKIEPGKPLEVMLNCEVKTPFTWNIKDVLNVVGAGVADEWRPEAGGIFATIELKKLNAGENCELPTGSGKTAEGSYNVEGTEICEINEPADENKKHRFNCAACNSTLSFGGRVGGYSGMFEVELASTKKYSAR